MTRSTRSRKLRNVVVWVGLWLMVMIVIMPVARADSALTPSLTRSLQTVTEPWGQFMGPDLLGQGFLPDLLDRLLGPQGMTLQHQFYPWARCLHMVRNGQADILTGVYYAPEREDYLLFSDPITIIEDVLLVPEANPLARYADLRELAGLRIGVVRGAAHGEAFDRAAYLEKSEVVDIEQGFRMLAYGRIDALAGPRVNLMQELREKEVALSAYRFLEPPIGTSSLHVGFARSRPQALELKEIFNKALRKARESGQLQALAADHGIDLVLPPPVMPEN